MGLSVFPPPAKLVSLSQSFFILIFLIALPPFSIAPWPFLLYVFSSYASSAPCVSTLGPCDSRASTPTLFFFHYCLIICGPSFEYCVILDSCAAFIFYTLFLISSFCSWHHKNGLLWKLFAVSLNPTDFLSSAGLFRKHTVQAKSGACLCQMDSRWFFSLLTLTN